jgi:hypothetical protein
LLHDIEGVLGSRGFGLDDLHEEGPPAGDNRFVQRNARYAGRPRLVANRPWPNYTECEG